MLKHPTVDKLLEMKLTGMVSALQQQADMTELQSLTFEDRLGLLIDAEFSERETTQLTKRLKAAKLRQAACLEDLDFKPGRGLDKLLIGQLADCDWIKKSISIMIIGRTGVGKSYVACALGQKACRAGFSVAYFRAPRFFQELTIARINGTYEKFLKRLQAFQVLILDDFALVPITEEQCRDMLEVTDDRCGRGSFILSSQLPVDSWHQTFANSTLADAILDRVVHGSYRINLTGPSRRKNKTGSDEQ
ncbi:MAG: ATP-binding protein [Candidatus Obscuribacter sp.]|nr:ATP-binding protein [Candidatus Obscuribacter sp.]